MVGAGGPLAGVRVVELGIWVAGPAAAGVMADWGADVVKVEPPGGDPGRTFGRMLGGDLPTNPPFELDNRSKRSIAVDLGTDAGRRVLERLLERADVFVTNIRPAALERLGLDYESLHARLPRLIYALVTGYGLDGPDADRPAYDIAAYWARAGVAASLAPPGDDLPFQRGGMGDHTTGMSTAGAVAAALFARERSGEGQMVSTSMFRQGMYFIGWDVNVALMWGTPIRVGTRQTMGSPTLNNYTAGDGRRFWIVGLDAERHWPPLARIVGRPEWTCDERFATGRARAVHARELVAELDAIFATASLEEWAERFATEPDMFWSPVNTVDDLVADPQALASGGFVDVPDGTSTTTMVASPVDFSTTRWAPRWVAPELGEHGAEILGELGYSPEEVEALLAGGVVNRRSDS